MDMSDANRRQNAGTYQETPAGCIVGVVVDGVVASVPQEFSIGRDKACQFGPAVGQVVQPCSKRRGFVIEEIPFAAGQEEVDLAASVLRPEAEDFHQPGFGAADAEPTDDLQDPNRPSHSYSSNKRCLLYTSRCV